MPKQRFIAMAGDSKLHTLVSRWEYNRVRNDDEDESNVSKLIELMFKMELHCFQGYFRKQTGSEDVEICEP